MPFKVMLHWSTCNADSQCMFFTRICRHVTLLNCFQRLPTCCSTADIAKNCPQRGFTLERFFSQHRIILQVDQCNTTFRLFPVLQCCMFVQAHSSDLCQYHFIILSETGQPKDRTTGSKQCTSPSPNTFQGSALLPPGLPPPSVSPSIPPSLPLSLPLFLPPSLPPSFPPSLILPPSLLMRMTVLQTPVKILYS